MQPDPDRQRPPRSEEAKRWRAAFSVSTFCLVIAGIAFATVLRDQSALSPSDNGPLYTLAVAVLFVAVATAPEKLFKSDNTLLVAPTEAVFVVGTLYLAPVGLLVGRVLGSLAEAHTRNLPLPKRVFNCALAAVETACFLVVARGVFDVSEASGLRHWVPFLIAAATSSTVTAILVAEVVHRATGNVPRRDVLEHAPIMVGTAMLNTCLGIVGVTLFQTRPENVVPLLALGVAGLLAYREFLRLRARYGQVTQMYEFASVVSSSKPNPAGIRAVAEKARQVLAASHAEVMLVDTSVDSEPLIVQIICGPGGAFREDVFPARLLEGPWRTVLDEGRPIHLPRGVDSSQAAVDRRSFNECIIAPLSGESGVMGTFTVGNGEGSDPFGRDEEELFRTLVVHAASWFENGRLVERLRDEIALREHEAYHDSLTNLPNRRMFQSRAEGAVENAVTNGHKGAVLLLDLDSFKEINDALGHHVGDEFLRTVARNIELVLPQGGVLARLGGDEFAILLPRVDSPDDAKTLALRIATELRQPVKLEDVDIEAEASIGIAVFPTDGTEATIVLQHADVAMYTAKTAKTGVEFYRTERDFSSHRRLELLSDLRRAIDQDQLFLEFQPKVELSSGRPTAVEALVRWRHPIHGRVMPDEFIPLAEQSGLIGPLTMLVLEKACRQLRVWMDADIPLHMAANLSVRNLLDENLRHDLAAMLVKHDVPASSLTLEITESGVMSDPTRAIQILKDLRSLGVRLAIDDFGTGQSSFAYIKELPVHEVKIDKRFVRGTNIEGSDGAIIRSVLDLSRSLGLEVVAEGVEDERTYRRLRDIGCHTAQGYFIGRPMNPDDIPFWMADAKRLMARTEQMSLTAPGLPS